MGILVFKNPSRDRVKRVSKRMIMNMFDRENYIEKTDDIDLPLLCHMFSDTL